MNLIKMKQYTQINTPDKGDKKLSAFTLENR